MSRRTLPLLAAAVVLTAAPLAPAQSPNPWRGPTTEPAPPPRAKRGAFGIEVTFNWATGRPTASVAAKEAMTLSSCGDAERCGPMVRMPDVRPVACEFGPSPASTAPAGRLTGTWFREMPFAVAAVTFAGDEVKAVLTQTHGGAVVTITVTADYAVTKDGTVHGVVTGTDVAVSGPADAVVNEVEYLAMQLQALVDQPFAARCRPTDGGLMVGNLRVAAGFGGGAMGTLMGKFKPAGPGPLPPPKPVVATTIPAPPFVSPSPYVASPYPPPCEYAPPAGGILPTAYRSGVTCPVPDASTVAPPPCPLPVEYRSRPAAPQLTLPPPPPEVRDVMLGTFGQMLGNPPAPPVLPSAYSPPPLPVMPPPEPLPIPPAVGSNVRMKQLLDQSEDLRQIGREWRRFWFNEKPHRLTPERIYGGII